MRAHDDRLTNDASLRAAFAQVIASLRLAKGLSQEELAAQSDLSLSYVSLLERGKRNLTVLAAAKIAQTLGVKPSVLLGKVETSVSEAPRPGRSRNKS